MSFLLNILAVLNGVYLFLFGSKTSGVTSARLLFGGSILLLIFPLCLPGLVYARNWYLHKVPSNLRLEGSSFILVDVDELEIHKGMVTREASFDGYQLLNDYVVGTAISPVRKSFTEDDNRSCCSNLIRRNQLGMLGEEHPLYLLLSRSDFWLYYIAYFCGGMIGLVYSNNLGQIAQSLDKSLRQQLLSRFIRLSHSSVDRFQQQQTITERSSISLEPGASRCYFSNHNLSFLAGIIISLPALLAGTALIGLSSGFIFPAAVSKTSELFEPNSVGVNHVGLILK